MTTKLEARTDIADDARALKVWMGEAVKQSGVYAPMTVGDGVRIAALLEALAERVAALEAPQPTPETELRRGIRGLFPDVQR